MISAAFSFVLCGELGRHAGRRGMPPQPATRPALRARFPSRWLCPRSSRYGTSMCTRECSLPLAPRTRRRVRGLSPRAKPSARRVANRCGGTPRRPACLPSSRPASRHAKSAPPRRDQVPTRIARRPTIATLRARFAARRLGRRLRPAAQRGVGECPGGRTGAVLGTGGSDPAHGRGSRGSCTGCFTVAAIAVRWRCAMTECAWPCRGTAVGRSD